MNLQGYSFTWDSGRWTDHWVEVRLDHALVTASWMELFGSARVVNLEISSSDHCPLRLETNILIPTTGERKFMFKNAW